MEQLVSKEKTNENKWVTIETERGSKMEEKIKLGAKCIYRKKTISLKDRNKDREWGRERDRNKEKMVENRTRSKSDWNKKEELKKTT